MRHLLSFLALIPMELHQQRFHTRVKRKQEEGRGGEEEEDQKGNKQKLFEECT